MGAARFYVERQRAQRRDAFIAQLPDLARVLSNGASAGLSLPAAVQLAARELPEPAAAEMRVVVQELRVGQPIEDALEALRDRLPSREVGVLMTTLVIQQRAGGDTVRALYGAGQHARGPQGPAARDPHRALGRGLHVLPRGGHRRRRRSC